MCDSQLLGALYSKVIVMSFIAGRGPGVIRAEGENGELELE